MGSVTPGPPAFLLGQRIDALTQERKRLQQAARDAKRAAQAAQSGRGAGRAAAADQEGRFQAAPASNGQGQPRRVGWIEIAQCAPNGRPQRGVLAEKMGKAAVVTT